MEISMIKRFNSLEEIQKYYDENTNTYIFKKDGEMIDLVIFNFHLDIKASINALDIEAKNIKAFDIKARDINARNINALDINASDIYSKNIRAWNIKAQDINYYSACFAQNSIRCKSIKRIRKHTKHFVLDGKLEIEK